jgi:hypothetical protein
MTPAELRAAKNQQLLDDLMALIDEEPSEFDELDDAQLLELRAAEARNQALHDQWAREEDTNPHDLAMEQEEALVPVEIRGAQEAGIGTDGKQLGNYIDENTDVVGRTLAQDFADNPGPTRSDQAGEDYLGASDSDSDVFEPFETPDAGGTDGGLAPVGEKMSFFQRFKNQMNRFDDALRGRGRTDFGEDPSDPRFGIEESESELSFSESDSESISWTEQQQTEGGGIRPFIDETAGGEAALRATLQDEVWSGGQGGRALSFTEAGRLIAAQHEALEMVELSQSRAEGQGHGGDINDPIPEADPFASEPLEAEPGDGFGGLDQPGEFAWNRPSTWRRWAQRNPNELGMGTEMVSMEGDWHLALDERPSVQELSPEFTPEMRAGLNEMVGHARASGLSDSAIASEMGIGISSGGGMWITRATMKDYMLKQGKGLLMAPILVPLTMFLNKQVDGLGDMFSLGMVSADLLMTGDPLGLLVYGVGQLWDAAAEQTEGG